MCTMKQSLNLKGLNVLQAIRYKVWSIFRVIYLKTTDHLSKIILLYMYVIQTDVVKVLLYMTHFICFNFERITPHMKDM